MKSTITPIERNTAHTTLEPVATIQPFFSGTMPLPPSINDAYDHAVRRSKQGKLYTARVDSLALGSFKVHAGWMLKSSQCDRDIIHSIQASKSKIPLGVELRFYFSTLWKSDLDNREKFAIDATFAHLQLNDNQVVDIHLQKMVDAQNPRVEIELRCIVR